ncbi:MAG: quinone oxidoreductase [Pseudomonadales bacterium]|nr:quinone oxidoreductase [Pseudomonadales bacterium]MCP5357502.1 quinone oxidoreductase [Pseudomonadales bacterium]
MPKAIIVEKTGDSSVMQLQDVKLGKPRKGEVTVRATAIGVNFIDIYQRTGLYPLPTPFTLGGELCGVVEAVGAGVTDFKIGDRVACGTAGTGCYAEKVNLKAGLLVKVPKQISDEVAAAMMLKGMTVQYLIRQIYKVKKGDTILVHAAAGGVGLILCQWAKSLGATVIGTVSSPAKAKLAKAHGCDYPIDYTKTDFVKKVKAITKGAMLPVVYDSIGKDTFPASLDCLRKFGLFVTYGNASGPVPPFAPALLAQKGSLMMTRPTLFNFVSTPEELRAVAGDLMKVVKSGAVKIEVNHRYALKDAAKAHDDLAARKTSGSIVLIP